MKYPTQVKHLAIPMMLTAAVLLAACEDTPRGAAAMGRSVEHMVVSQTYNPNAAANPAVLAPDGGDGQRLINALDAHRKDVPRGQEQVTQPIVFEVGKSQ
jgi:predicted small secreted protein